MWQEIIETTNQPETVDKAIKFGAIGMNIVVMALASFVVMAVYALKSKNTPIATVVWLKANGVRFGIGFTLMIALAVLLVVSPDIGALFNAIGFNVDKSPMALGMTVGLLMLGITSEPSKKPEG